MRRVIGVFLILVTFSFAQTIKVQGMEFAVAIQDREPIGISDKFPPDIGKVYCWTKIYTEKIPTKIYHVWYYQGNEMARVELGITYHTFRTWSSKKILPQWTGEWTVVVEDENGNEIARKSFEITEHWK
ncbi:Protein of unknown function [Persephonella hydrogeniphila]|uniref:DUF2914 domain-containing protein n=1 Tax=Persephonella hydrogeniphila TaxID=198703 RepID=A0A285NA26_9AQUI|nr:DUF2914 domain-containing protein [Persephonella hydrogeniphila]SNZ06280.1 Protein of unknown function [Persephonella hydrogeniphila]